MGEGTENDDEVTQELFGRDDEDVFSMTNGIGCSMVRLAVS